MKIINVEQGTPEWFACRLGKLTASDGQAIATSGKGLETLCYEKVAEILTGKQKPSYTNEDIERGHEMEKIARNSYELETGNLVEQVGFVELDEFTGCSPDGFVGKDGLVEIKCKSDANFVRYMYEKKVETEYNWQMQMQMYVTGRQWVDYVVFNENFEKNTIILKVVRNEADIAKIKSGIENGIMVIKQIVSKIK